MILIFSLIAPNVVTIKTEVKMNTIMILKLIRNPLLLIKVILSFLFLYDFIRCVSFGSNNDDDRIIKSTIKDQMGQGKIFSLWGQKICFGPFLGLLSISSNIFMVSSQHLLSSTPSIREYLGNRSCCTFGN